jgi:release factor glutamine methyltransferase
MTVAETLREGERQLAAAGVPNAALDAELLLRHVTNWERAEILTMSAEELAPAFAQEFLGLVAALAARKPLQHLTGRQAFWKRDFVVSPDVLIPRPETEILVEAALESLTAMRMPAVVDVGTGSGCIAVSIAAERPDAHVTGTDISGPALVVARENAARAGVAGRVSLAKGDLLEPVQHLKGQIQAVLSNPPYVDLTERAALQPEVRDHEPAVALFPPAGRYSIYRRLIPDAAEYLAPGGWLILEVGQGMADAVVHLCTDSGFVLDATLDDLQGIPRVVVGRKP